MRDRDFKLPTALHENAALLRPVVLAALLIGGAVSTSCNPGNSEAVPPLPPGHPGAAAGRIQFIDTAAELGIDIVTTCGNMDKLHLPEVNCTGVAVEDYDNDGDLDFYFSTAQTRDDWLAGNRPKANALYRNNGDGTFTEVAEEAGVALKAWALGAYFVDYDNDSDKDLYVTCRAGPNVLFRNNGDGTFTDVTEASGLAGPPIWSTSAAFGDLDADGDLDLYVTNYCEFDIANPPFEGKRTIFMGMEVLLGPMGLVGAPDHLYRNNGDGTFTNITREAGIDLHPPFSYGMGVVMSDLDQDGDLDIFVANDSVANYLWRNDGGLRFTELAHRAGVATNEDAKDQAGMGADAADYNGDGRTDLFVTNFSHDFNTLYRNEGDLVFTDATFEASLSDSFSPLVWGTKFFDYDNDGRLDLFVANGHVYPEVEEHPHLSTSFKQANTLYWNRGDGSFENRTASAGPGLAIVESTRGAAVADLDRDGDLDLLLTNLDAPPSVLVNEGGNRSSWISLRLVGVRSNRDGVGARLELETNGMRQVREVNPYGSYLSQSSYEVHFGLDKAERVERLVVHWPSGETDELKDLPARTFLTITEGQGVTAESQPLTPEAP